MTVTEQSQALKTKALQTLPRYLHTLAPNFSFFIFLSQRKLPLHQKSCTTEKLGLQLIYMLKSDNNSMKIYNKNIELARIYTTATLYLDIV